MFLNIKLCNRMAMNYLLFGVLFHVSCSQFSPEVDIRGEVLKQQVQKIRQAVGDQIEMIFVVDSSGSVGAENFVSEVDFVKKFVSGFSISYSQTRVALINFSNVVEIPFDHISGNSRDNHKCVMKTDQLVEEKITYIGSGTYTLGAMAEARRILAHARPGAMRIVFLVTDGESNGGDPRPEAEELKNMGALIFTIGIANGNVAELRDMATTPFEEHTYILDSFADFEALARRALREDLKSGTQINLDPSSCSSMCSSSSNCCDATATCTCGTYTGAYSCLCPPGYSGTGLEGHCIPCPVGTYYDSQTPGGISSCRSCPPNKTSREGSLSIAQCYCLPGYRTVGQQCQMVTCPPLSPPLNGVIINHQCYTHVGATCQFKCSQRYLLVGSATRTCGQMGYWSGASARCQEKPCPPPTHIYNGGVRCTYKNNRVGTVCNFHCDSGYFMTGDARIECTLPEYWDKHQPSCRTVQCPPLTVVKYGIVSPPNCATGHSIYGTTCSFSCDLGFDRKGPTSTTCDRTGQWTYKDNDVKCDDIEPPTLVCPEDVEYTTSPNEDFAIVQLDRPIINDNSNENILKTSTPAYASPQRLPIGVHTIMHEAEDFWNNRNSCNSIVTVLDKENPRVDKCESPPIIVSEETSLTVQWEDPIFSDNSGKEVQVTQSMFSGSVLPKGTTLVNYVATDDSGNEATCNIAITVQNHRCVMPSNPDNGVADCTEGDDAIYCYFYCDYGFTFALETEDEYSCEYDNGIWWPNDDPLNFQDCSVTETPRSTVIRELKVDFTNTGLCNDHSLLEQIKSSLLVTLQLGRVINEKCSDDVVCQTDFVELVCDEIDSDSTASSYPHLPQTGRKKRSIVKQNHKYQFKNKLKTIYLDGPKQTIAQFIDESDNMRRVRNKRQIDGERKMTTNGSGEEFEENSTGSVTEVLNEDEEDAELNKFLEIYGLTTDDVVIVAESKTYCEPGYELAGDICVECPIGSHFNPYLDACDECPENTFQNETGQMICFVCPDKTRTRQGLNTAEDDCKAFCSAGFYSADGLDPCNSCEEGQYQNLEGKSSCETCPEGTTTNRRGSWKHDQCEAPCLNGHASRNGLFPCFPCPIGHYQHETGLTYCYRCPDGSTNNNTGDTSPITCKGIAENTMIHFSSHELLYFNECFKTPCTRGTCTPLDSGYKCICRAGYAGDHCEIDFNECNSQPCANGAICTDLVDSYTCRCRRGFTGQDCETNIDDCTSDSCQNRGTCIDGVDSYLCVCELGYTGRGCEVNINNCVGDPCSEGSTCVDLLNDFRCECPPGIMGRQCETKVDLCSKLPCKHGSCTATVNNYRCSCEPGYVGVNCDTNVNECDPNPCLHGGVCVDQVNKYTCQCKPGFRGLYCGQEYPTNFVMNFLTASVLNYAILDTLPQTLSEISVCFWMRSSNRDNYGTPFSYATEHHDNAFTLTDYNGFVICVNNEYRVTDVETNDGEWHFICASWESVDGRWMIYLDGNLADAGTGLAEGTTILADGSFVLGQEQDNRGSLYNIQEAFVGELSHLNVWDKFLTEEEVHDKYTECDRYVGNVKGWPDFISGIRGQLPITYTCGMGKLEDAEGSCAFNGTSSSDIPCDPIPCAEPIVPINGFLEKRIDDTQCTDLDSSNCSRSETQSIGSVTFDCKLGYNLEGDEEITCSHIGSWSNEFPACKIAKCANIPSPPNNSELSAESQSTIHPDIDEFVFNTTVRYSCLEGHWKNGQLSTTCTDDNTWSNISGECQRVYCGPPRRTDRGMYYHQRSFFYNDKVTIHCRQGTEMTGSPTVTCQSDGKWTRLPSCTTPCYGKCANGGQCINTYTCLCKAGYRGKFCRIKRCQNDCLNGGECVGRNRCMCLPGWGGNQCQTSICECGCSDGWQCLGPNICMSGENQATSCEPLTAAESQRAQRRYQQLRNNILRRQRQRQRIRQQQRQRTMQERRGRQHG